jgi:hypothetical protein
MYEDVIDMPMDFAGFLFGEAPMTRNAAQRAVSRTSDIGIASGWNRDFSQGSYSQRKGPPDIKI